MSNENQTPAAAGEASSRTSGATATNGAGPWRGIELDDLLRRIEKLEAALTRAEEDVAASRLLEANVRALVQEVRAVGSRVDRIAQALSGSIGYRMRDVFECDACGSKGNVAGRIVCTSCRRESWWGWWPDA
jgi:hypothetical protein